MPPWHDALVVVFDVDHGPLAVIFHRLFADAVQSAGLEQQGVAAVFFICQDIADHLIGPGCHTLRCRRMVGLRLPFDVT